MKFFYTIVLILIASSLMRAQTGFIRGTVFDDSNGESLPGSTVAIEGTTQGTITDLDGNFNIKIAPGTYTVRVSFISYEALVISNVEVKANDVTILDNVRLKESKIELGEVVVTAKEIRNTEAALNTIKMKSANLLDGISASSLRKIGDSDAAASMKRVPGVSVEGGRYVYVRGLGDRYTKTVLNGVDVPGLDPDRNSIQMDLFPTNIIDNLLVHKSFSADLPADFTGGVVDIEVKDFPEEQMGKVSIGAGFNPNYHFNDDFLTYEGGNTDWLGYDDGTRAIPAKTNVPQFTDAISDAQSAERYSEILRNFSPTMAAMKEKSFMDYDFGISYGNQHPLAKVTIGYNFAFSYKKSTEFYKDAVYGKYGRESDNDVNELIAREYRKGDLGVENVFLSGLAGFALKTKASKFRLYFMHLQNGESKAGIFTQNTNNLGTTWDGFQHSLDYSQRSLSNLLLDGKHILGDNKFEIVWKLSPTISRMSDPDIRFTRYVVRDDGATEIGTESGFPIRNWRELEETNLAGVLHLTNNFDFSGRKSKLKLGGAYTYKERNFEIINFNINPRGDLTLTGDPDELFTEQNLWPYEGDNFSGITYDPGFIPTNPSKFDANVNYSAAYVSAELPLLEQLKLIAGLRYENFVQNYTGQNQLGTKVLDNDEVINDSKLFPTASLIYSLSENQNLRFSFSQTTARPSFKELSFAQIFDPVSDIYFIGGLNDDIGLEDGEEVVYWNGDLKVSDIQNFDIRWELFQEGGQMVSISAFYKTFNNPIELVQLASSTQKTQVQPRNVGDGQVMGAEIEARKNLAFLSDALSNLTVMANFTYTQSRIKMSDTEYEDRLRTARTGQEIDDYRDMAGQAPFIINAGLSYAGEPGAEGFRKGLEAGLYYNMQGLTLLYVGSKNKPDVYAVPFHSLNFNSSKSFGSDGQFQVGLKISNILDAKKQTRYVSYEAGDEYYFSNLEIGRTFSVKIGYSF